MQELRPDFVEDADFDTNLSEPTLFELETLESEINDIKPKKVSKSQGEGYVFIGHGRNKIWARLQIFLKDDLNLKTLTFEDESRTSETIINILDDFLNYDCRR